jgi:hypothetical protein
MKTRLSFIAMFLALGIAVALLAQNAPPAAQNLKSADHPSTQVQSTHSWHLPAGFTADQAYKANCTRCHAEVPKMGARRTKTVVLHMRVRANLTQDEAEAILEYLNK